jgi:hypothetical protein
MKMKIKTHILVSNLLNINYVIGLNYKNQADVKVFVVKYENQDDTMKFS